MRGNIKLEVLGCGQIDDSNVAVLSTEKFHKMCRLCLSEKPKRQIHSIFELEYSGMGFISILQSCMAIRVRQDDGLPKKMCSTCVKRLIECYDFKMQCENSDIILRKVLELERWAASDSAEWMDEFVVTGYGNKRKPHSNSAKRVKQAMPALTASPMKRKKRTSSVEALERLLEGSDLDESSEAIVVNTQKSTQEKAVLLNVQENVGLQYVTQSAASSQTAEASGQESYIVNSTVIPTSLPFSCTACNLSFETYDELIRHFKQVMHKQVKLVQVTTPDEQKGKQKVQFKIKVDEGALKKQMALQEQEKKSYVCNICKEDFTKLEQLILHKRIHPSEATFICIFCGDGFLQANDYTSHLIEAHQNFNTAPSVIETKEDEPSKPQESLPSLSDIPQVKKEKFKGYLCKCGKAFLTHVDYKSHRKIHSRIRNFNCEICKKTFAQRASLMLHKVQHRGSKPFRCKACLKGFRKRHALIQHLKLHADDTLQVCGYCGKHFSDNKELVEHMATHAVDDDMVGDEVVATHTVEDDMTGVEVIQEHEVKDEEMGNVE